MLYGRESEEFPLTCGFVVKTLLNLKKCHKKRRGELKKKTEIVFIEVHLKTGR